MKGETSLDWCAIALQIYLVIYCTPVGIASLIAQTILKACNIVQLLQVRADTHVYGSVNCLHAASACPSATPWSGVRQFSMTCTLRCTVAAG